MFAASILLGLAANLDNLGIGIAYGVQNRLIRLPQNVLIAAVTTAITYAAFAAGDGLHRYLLASLPNWLSGGCVIAFALFGLIRSGAQATAIGCHGEIGWRETVVLAATLSLNNIGLAIAGGFAGLSYRAALASIFGFSIALLSAGQIIGREASRSVDTMLTQPWIGNVILLLTGIMMVLGL